MDIRSSVDSLKTLLGATQATPAKSQPAKSESTGGTGSLGGDRATLSSAGSEVSQAASESDVRMDKVSAVQAALAAGTYNVPASAVAGKVVESMLNSGPSGS
jgi:negative regulator of flagellin synthesis FlgM